MADFANVQPDEYKLLGCNFSAGRPFGIKGVTIHHMAGDLNADQCNGIWGANGCSAHYSVDRNGYIVQHVNDTDRAYACGDGIGSGGGNDTTISIEHANSARGPWTVHEAAIESGAHLVAALCLYYGLGRPAWMVNVFPHKHWSSTACPGELGPGGSQHDAYMARAQAWYDAMAGGAAQPGVPAQRPEQEPGRRQVAVDGKWGRETTLALQERYGLYADGIVSGQNASFKGISAGCLYGSFEWVPGGGSGSPTIKALQGTIGAAADGFVGPDTWRALIAYGMARGSGAAYNDARLDDPSVTIEWLQRSLNAGTL